MLARADEARGFGYPERFLRMYEFYFVYCEAGFANRCASKHASLAGRSARTQPS
jgi:cyclopropane-fatty-acyl-phospholipid synthase